MVPGAGGTAAALGTWPAGVAATGAKLAMAALADLLPGAGFMPAMEQPARTRASAMEPAIGSGRAVIDIPFKRNSPSPRRLSAKHGGLMAEMRRANKCYRPIWA